MKKVDQYVVINQGGSVGAAGDTIINGKFSPSALTVDAGEISDIPYQDIVHFSVKGGQALVAYDEDITFTNNATEGEVFTVTLQMPSSAQYARHTYRYYAQGTATPTIIAAALRDQINAESDSTGVTASAAGGVLTLASSTSTVLATAGTDSSTTTVAQVVNAQYLAETDGAYYGSIDGIDPADFVPGDRYKVLYVVYRQQNDQTFIGASAATKCVAIYIEVSVASANLTQTLDGTYPAAAIANVAEYMAKG
jgi:hypothetical protein